MVYKPLVANILRSVSISIITMSTRLTHKLRLTLSICFLAVLANVAGARSVARIDQNYGNTQQCSFVDNETAKLVKGPSAHACSLLFPEPCPVAYPLEIFNGDSGVRAFGLVNDASCDLVVISSPVIRFILGHGFKPTLSRLGSDRLQHLPAFVEPDTLGLKFGTRIGVPIGVHSDLSNTEIDTEHLGRDSFRYVLQLDRDQKVKRALDVNKIGLSDLDCFLQSGFLVASNHHRDNQATVERPKRHVCQTLEPHNSLVVHDCGSFTENGTFLFVPFEALDSFADCPDRQLCSKSVLSTQLAVSKAVYARLRKHFGLKANLGCVASRQIESLESTQQCVFLGGVGKQFDFDCELHVRTIDQSAHKSSELFVRDIESLQPTRYPSPCLKAGVSREETDDGR